MFIKNENRKMYNNYWKKWKYSLNISAIKSYDTFSLQTKLFTTAMADAKRFFPSKAKEKLNCIIIPFFTQNY